MVLINLFSNHNSLDTPLQEHNKNCTNTAPTRLQFLKVKFSSCNHVVHTYLITECLFFTFMKEPITLAIYNRPSPEMGWPHDRVLSWVKRRILIGTLAPVSLSNVFSISNTECCELFSQSWKCWWRRRWIGRLYMLFIASGSLTRSAFPPSSTFTARFWSLEQDAFRSGGSRRLSRARAPRRARRCAILWLPSHCANRVYGALLLWEIKSQTSFTSSSCLISMFLCFIHHTSISFEQLNKVLYEYILLQLHLRLSAVASLAQSMSYSYSHVRVFTVFSFKYFLLIVSMLH